jgi:hypothetical protein
MSLKAKTNYSGKVTRLWVFHTGFSFKLNDYEHKDYFEMPWGKTAAAQMRAQAMFSLVHAAAVAQTRLNVRTQDVTKGGAGATLNSVIQEYGA